MSSIKIRSQQIGNLTEIRILISHPMENGRNRDPLSGDLIPAHFIEEVQVQLNGAPLLSMNMAGSMAKNPYFAVRLQAGRGGDRISVSWRDNRLGSDAVELVLDGG